MSRRLLGDRGMPKKKRKFCDRKEEEQTERRQESEGKTGHVRRCRVPLPVLIGALFLLWLFKIFDVDQCQECLEFGHKRFKNSNPCNPVNHVHQILLRQPQQLIRRLSLNISNLPLSILPKQKSPQPSYSPKVTLLQHLQALLMPFISSNSSHFELRSRGFFRSSENLVLGC